MARKGKARQEAEDAAYLKTSQPELPMEQAPAPSNDRYLHFDRVPEKCPKCDKSMTFASGWALVFGDMLQCGGCAQTIQVPREEYTRFANGLHSYFRREQDRLKIQKKIRLPRQRGAD